jgi:mannosyltransferase
LTKRGILCNVSRYSIPRWSLIFLAFALRLYRLPQQSIWWDEGHSISMAAAPLAAIPGLPGMDVHPPGYFWLLHLWMGLAGKSEFALRFFSLLFSVATVALLFRFARRLGGRESKYALLAAAIVALSPLHLAYAQEVRMYSLVTFFALGSVYAFRELGQGNTRRAWLLYVLTTAVSLYTHYFFGFVLIFQNIYWLISWLLTRQRRMANPPVAKLLTWLSAQLAVLLLYVPQILAATRQVTAYANVNLEPPTCGEFLAQTWQAFTIGLTVRAGWAGPLMALFAAVLVLGLGATVAPGRKAAQDKPEVLLFLAAWLILPLAVYFVVLQRRASFEPRYLMLITPALCLLLAWGVSALTSRARLLGWLAGGALLAASLVGCHSYLFDPAFYKDDTRGLASFLKAETRPRDVVFWDIPYAIDYYYPQDDPAAAPGRYLFVDIHTAAEVLSREGQGRERLFWVRWRESDTDPRRVIIFLLEKYGAKLGELDFRGYNVVWYQLPPESNFELAPEMEPVAANFGGELALTGQAYGGRGQGETATEAEVNRKSVPAGRKMWAVLDWQALAPMNENFKAGLYLHDGQWNKVAQDDRDILSDRHLRTSGWTAGEQTSNVYLLEVAPDTPPGEYILEVAVYERESLTNLDILDQVGNPQGTTFVLGTVQVVGLEDKVKDQQLTFQHPYQFRTTLGVSLLLIH